MTPEQQDTALSLFAGSDNLKKAAKAVGVGVKRLRSCWVKKFGEEAVRGRGERVRLASCGESRAQDETLQAKRQKALQAFSTIESGNQIAARLKISRKSLREWWLAEYGQKTVDERGTKMLASGSLLHEGNEKISETHKSILDAFTGSDSSLDIAKISGVSPSVLRRWWIKEYGEEKVRERGVRTKHRGRPRLSKEGLVDARSLGLQAFHTDEPVKTVAKQLGVAYPVLRRWWIEEFGEEILRERGKALQSKRASESGRSRRGEVRNLSLVTELCGKCGSDFELNRISLGKSAQKICPSCRDEKQDPVSCPICQMVCEGQRGLASHFRHRKEAGDLAHQLWETQTEEAKWAEREEGENYVVCQACGFRGESLASHLRKHGLDATSYLEKYPDALIRSCSLTEKRARAIVASWKRVPRKGARKLVACPSCGDTHEASMFLVLGVHESRCDSCRVAMQLVQLEAREKAEFSCLSRVVCVLCEGFVSDMRVHVREKHSEITDRKLSFRMGALENGAFPTRGFPGRMILTVADLAPFTDEQGRVIVLKATAGLGCVPAMIRDYCQEFGIATKNKLAFQRTILDLVSKILGGVSYEWEYVDDRIRNPKTGRLFRYDGYFSSVHLIVEVHGVQHEKFIPTWHKSLDTFEERKARDILKRDRALEEGYEFFVVRQSDPDRFDEQVLRKRLSDLGIPT